MRFLKILIYLLVAVHDTAGVWRSEDISGNLMGWDLRRDKKWKRRKLAESQHSPVLTLHTRWPALPYSCRCAFHAKMGWLHLLQLSVKTHLSFLMLLLPGILSQNQEKELTHQSILSADNSPLRQSHPGSVDAQLLPSGSRYTLSSSLICCMITSAKDVPF